MDVVNRRFPNGLPTLEQLRSANDEGVPKDSAWIWGEDDEIGRLNLLTPERILSAKDKELKDGDVVSLNWAVTLPAKPSFGRAPCSYRRENHGGHAVVFDDFINTNTQSGSQWDGFRHVGHFAAGVFYNGLTPDEVNTTTRCGIQAASAHGIVGRGVLLDYYGWKARKGEKYDPFTSHAIQLEELLEVARAQHVEFEVGDILLVRTGYISAYHEYEQKDPRRLDDCLGPSPPLAGVAPTEEIKTWLHDSYFSAVGGDSPTFECWPPTKDFLHQYLLACWGMMIGEMFDLEALAKQCERKQRWSFFFMSTPFNVPGGVASFANAMAIH